MAEVPDRDAAAPWQRPIGEPNPPAPAAPAATPAAPAAAPAAPATTGALEIRGEAVGLGQAGRIFVAVFGTWTGLASVPASLPWNAVTDADRAIAVGAIITSLVATLSVPVSVTSSGSRRLGAMWVGLSAALIGLGLAGIQVVRSLLVPAGIDKNHVLGVGLVALLVFAFLMAWRRQVVGVGSTTRFSTLSVVGTTVAVLLIGAYLVVTNSMLNFVRVPAEEWARYTDLRSGLESLAFGAAGALLGTAIQKQAADRAANRADDNARIAAANYAIAVRALDLAERAAAAAPATSAEEGTPQPPGDQTPEIDALRTRLRLPR